MDNQHKKITGYRNLSQSEIDLMNEIKAKGAELDALVSKLRGFPSTAADGIPRMHETFGGEPVMLPSLDKRWISIGATHLQEGLMALTRGIAQPSTF